MKSFLLKCLLFVTLMTAIVAATWHLVIGSCLKEVYTLSPDRHILMLGNSHIKFGVDDSEIPGVFNFAYEEQYADGAYRRLKLLHSLNPGIDTVVVGLDNVMTYTRFRDGLPGGEISPRPLNTIVNFNADLASQMSPDDIMAIARMSHTDLIYDQLMSLLRVETAYAYYRRAGFEAQRESNGGFKKFNRNSLQNEIAEVKSNKSIRHLPERFEMPPYVAYYVDHIVDYCRQNHIKLIFMCTPQYPINVYDTEHYRHIIAERYPDVTFLDYFSFPLTDDCFADTDHLNEKGARVFTNHLKHTRFNDPEWEYSERDSSRHQHQSISLR